MSGKRVLIVAPEFPPQIGGMQQYAYFVARGLCDRGYEVRVLTLVSNTQQKQHDFSIDARLTGKTWTDIKLISAYRDRFDIVHVMNYAWAWIGAYVGNIVVSIHGNDVLDPAGTYNYGLRERFHLPIPSRVDYLLGKWRTHRMLQRSSPYIDAVIANSHYTADIFRRKTDYAGTIEVAFVGVDDEYFVQRHVATKKGGFKILSVARLADRRKNIDLVLRALAISELPGNWCYDVVGDGHLSGELTGLARELGLEQHVKFHGRLDKSELMQLYANADVMALPSDESTASVEGFGIVYLEANATGVPVIGVDKGGASEAIEQNVSGIKLAEANKSDLVEALQDIASGNKVFSSFECRRHAEKFRWENVIDIIESVYRGINVND